MKKAKSPSIIVLIITICLSLMNNYLRIYRQFNEPQLTYIDGYKLKNDNIYFLFFSFFSLHLSFSPFYVPTLGPSFRVRSSGAMQDGLKGLLGLTLNWDGRYKSYTMRKYSNAINIAWDCSSVTIDPHAWTCMSPYS